MLQIEVKEIRDGKFILFCPAPAHNSAYAKRWPVVLNDYLGNPPFEFSTKEEAETNKFFAEKYYELGRTMRR